MKLTETLKGWLVEHAHVGETASDEEFLKAAREIGLEIEDEPKEEAPDLAKTIVEAVAVSVAPLAERVEVIAKEVEGLRTSREDSGDLKAQIDKLAKTIEQPKPEEPKKDSETPAAKMFGRPTVDLIPIDKMYSDSRSSLYYPADHKAFPNQPVMYGVDHASPIVPTAPNCSPLPAKHLESPSELDYAISGAYVKWAANAQNLTGRPLPRKWQMTDHDREIMKYAIHERKWSGIVGRGSNDNLDESTGSQHVVHDRKLSEWQRKALLDDSTSGGLEAAPIEFDAAVITTPLLYGELFPLISVVPVTRGRRMEGVSIANPTFVSGTAEGTAIGLFNTAAMIAAFDTTIYNAVGAIQIGMDFEDDSPIAIGQLVIQQYGEAAKNWLDNQIANGDGTTEMQGLFNATGITDIGNPAGGANAAPQPDDYITLAFSVNKEYRPASDMARCVYVGNDTSYRRARAIQVSTTDERRVLGYDVASYKVLEWPFKVQNNIANTYCGFFAMKYYRAYRRLGMTVRVETAGQTLALANETLIVVRMRWGGQFTLGGAGSYSDNWQT